MIDNAKETLLILIIALLAAAGFVMIGYHAGSKDATTAAELAEKGRTAAAVQAQADEDRQTLERERQLRRLERETFTTYQKEHQDADQKTERVIAGLRADVVRLRIPIRSHCPAAPDAGGPAAAGAGEEGSAELTAGSAEFLVRLTQRGDDAIRKHAAVVDLYEHLRAACTATPEAMPEATPQP